MQYGNEHEGETYIRKENGLNRTMQYGNDKK